MAQICSDYSREHEKSNSRIGVLDYEMSSGKCDGRMINPNFGNRKDASESININSYNKIHPNANIVNDVDNYEWCPIRSKEHSLLPNDMQKQQIQADVI